MPMASGHKRRRSRQGSQQEAGGEATGRVAARRPRGSNVASNPATSSPDPKSAHEIPQWEPQQQRRDPAMMPSLGPYLRVKLDPSDKLWSELVLALECGIASQVSWALNILQVLSFTEKDRWQRFLGCIARLPAVVSALVALINDGRTGGNAAAFANGSTAVLGATNEPPEARTQSEVAGSLEAGGLAGVEAGRPRDDDRGPREADAPLVAHNQPSPIGTAATGLAVTATGGSSSDSDSWWANKWLLNPIERISGDRLQFALAAANVLCNLSVFPDHAPALASNQELVSCLCSILLDWETEDLELVTSAVDVIQNISPVMHLSLFCPSDGHHEHMPEPPPTSPLTLALSVVQRHHPERAGALAVGAVPRAGVALGCGVRRLLGALQAVLWSPVRAWHAAAAESLGRLLANGQSGNVNFLLMYSMSNQLFERLATLLGDKDLEVKASAVTALASFVDASLGAQLRIAETPRLLGRLLSSVTAFPPPYIEVARRAAAAVDTLSKEPQVRGMLSLFEDRIVGLAFSDTCKVAEVFARILLHVSDGSHPLGPQAAPFRNIWSVATGVEE